MALKTNFNINGLSTPKHFENKLELFEFLSVYKISIILTRTKFGLPTTQRAYRF